MFNIVSIIIGLVALALAAVAFLPLLGWANWLIIPLAVSMARAWFIARPSCGAPALDALGLRQ